MNPPDKHFNEARRTANAGGLRGGGARMALRVMVFNDSKEILELFHEILSDEGYEVLLGSFGIDDLAEVERVKPELLVLDHVVGRERSGWQLLQKLKMRRSTAHIPVVVCTTAIKLAKEMEGYLTSKGVSVVLKPFDIDDLLNAVKKALEFNQSAVSFAEAENGGED
jgi:DNA-binding response OmpR family regulator